MTVLRCVLTVLGCALTELRSGRGVLAVLGCGRCVLAVLRSILAVAGLLAACFRTVLARLLGVRVAGVRRYWRSAHERSFAC